MTATLSYDLKTIMKYLAKDDRWNVLTVLMLHANIRNRCYPSMQTIADMATNGNLHKATDAKKWLEKHGAFELVPYAKRVDDEKMCGKRQHIYQLTGLIKGCGSIECDCWHMGEYHYLYFGKPNADDIASIDNIKGADIVPINNITRPDIAPIDNVSGDNRSIPIESKRDSDTSVSGNGDKKPKRQCLAKDIQHAIGESVMEWQPLNGWHWKQLNSKKLADDLLPHNITLDEIKAFRRWYTWKYPNAPYSHPNIIAGKIDLMRADVRAGKFRLIQRTVVLEPEPYEPENPEMQAKILEKITALNAQMKGA